MGRPLAALVLVAALSALSSGASAHVGAVPATAVFSAPVPPVMDNGTLLPYTPSTADGSFRIVWEDGDIDPTGKFDFYYLPYQPHYQVGAAWIQQNATPLLEVGQADANPARRWVACSCNADLGVTCPDAGPRPCDNELLWDTSAIAPGAYFVIAVNQDDPFLTFSPADGPVIISHGGPVPPAVVVLRPDGIGNFDKSYDTRWFAVGKGPLKFDLAYGKSASPDVLGPTTLLGRDVAPTALPDGTFGWTWDLTTLPGPTRAYYFRVTVTDADGVSSFSNSRFQLTVYHPSSPPDLGPDAGGAATADLAVDAGGGGGGGGCTMPGAGSQAPLVAVCAALLAAAIALVARRRRRR